jgi:N-acetylneuraminic acid mutarotase
MKRFACAFAVLAADHRRVGAVPRRALAELRAISTADRRKSAGRWSTASFYILGAYGANAPGGLAGWLNEYDPAADKWTKKTDIPMPVHHQAMTGFRDKVYVFGGGVKISPTSDNWYPTNRVWEYTPATNAWRELGPMPTKRGGGHRARAEQQDLGDRRSRGITRCRPTMCPLRPTSRIAR